MYSWAAWADGRPWGVGGAVVLVLRLQNCLGGVMVLGRYRMFPAKDEGKGILRGNELGAHRSGSMREGLGGR